MSMDRRQFLKFVAGSSVLGLGASVAPAIAYSVMKNPRVEPNQDALTAKQWAMVIDMSKFKSDEDIKKVISACHTTHNVPDFGNSKDEITWIARETYEHTFLGRENPYLLKKIKDMPFLVLCNHCENPPCVRVCPTQATFKRKQDGIVMIDMHRCIGCRYCMAACPYGARSFNWRDPRPFIKNENQEYPTRTRGVVEKCNFCAERLAVGKLPSCVEASPKGGLIFGDPAAGNSEVKKILATRYTVRRKPELGTGPNVYYLIGNY